MLPTTVALIQGHPPELTYNVPEGMLTGSVDGEHFSLRAGSGGRAGSKVAGAVHPLLANNPFATRVKLPANRTHPGGPLPLNVYRLMLHESRTNWIRLIPLDGDAMYGRAGMAIHARGQRGSDGCIVPTDFADVLRLCRVVKNRDAAGGPDVLLQVIAMGDLDHWLRLAEFYRDAA
jgi:hypothetical protein